MKKFLPILTTLAIISASTYAGNSDNPSIFDAEKKAFITVIKQNYNILALPDGRNDRNLNWFLARDDFSQLKSYAKLFNASKHYKAKYREAQKNGLTKNFERYYVEDVTKNSGDFHKVFIEETRRAIVEATKNWHREFKRVKMRSYIKKQDKEIKERSDALKKQIGNLKTQLRSDENWLKNHYKPLIKNGQKTKAHLKGALIEKKEKFDYEVLVLKNLFWKYRDDELAFRAGKFRNADHILREDTKNDTLYRLRFGHIIFNELAEYDYDKYLSKQPK